MRLISVKHSAGIILNPKSDDAVNNIFTLIYYCNLFRQYFTMLIKLLSLFRMFRTVRVRFSGIQKYRGSKSDGIKNRGLAEHRGLSSGGIDLK